MIPELLLATAVHAATPTRHVTPVQRLMSTPARCFNTATKDVVVYRQADQVVIITVRLCTGRIVNVRLGSTSSS